MKDKQIINNHYDIKNENIDQFTGDNNIIINNDNGKNYYFILPFGQKEIDGLIPNEKYIIRTNEVGLKDGYTMEYVINDMNRKKEMSKKLNLKKELAKNMLQELDELGTDEYQYLFDTIDKITDVDILNLIIHLLNKSYCTRCEINNKIVDNEIKKEEIINNLLNI